MTAIRFASKLRSPIKWPGGKSYDVYQIISRFPPHRRYVETHLGGGSILLNAPAAEERIANDIDAALVNFWRELQRPLFEGNPLIQHVAETPYIEAVFDRARHARSLGHLAPDIDAATFLVVNRFSRSALGQEFGWSDRLRGGQPEYVNAWDTIRTLLPAANLATQGVTFHCNDALDVIDAYDDADTLFYVDPPYPHDVRVTTDLYRHEMDRKAHIPLLARLQACRGAVLLSSYSNPLYNSELANWECYRWTRANHMGQGKTKKPRTEVLFYKPSRAA
jgi:DNA adenine methylase